tara:strand:+ start:114 stop:839 length:726 start_codon:yes stop_codon:yes gene_type:complete
MKSSFVRQVMKKYKVTQLDLANEWAKLEGKPKFQEVVSRALSREKIDSIVFAQALANIVMRPVGTLVNESLLNEEEDYNQEDFKQDLVIKPLDTYGDIDNNGVIMQCPAKNLNRNIDYYHWNNVLTNMRPTLNVGDSLIIKKIFHLDFKNIDEDSVILCFDNFKQIHLGRTTKRETDQVSLFSDDVYAYQKGTPIDHKNVKHMYKVDGFVSYDTENKSNHFMKELESLRQSIESIKQSKSV